ncbi:sphingomyelin phosphodiesterase 5-like [Pitangus sulphuratus]|nr:sphingomyelin phosphodiesterase 5-like [Pitangus sulphuratus]
MPWPPPTSLPESPFPSPALAVLDAVAGGLLAPSWWALDRLLALRPTTAQRARWRGRGGRCCGVGVRVLAGLALVPALLLSLPLGALGLLLWLPVQAARRPFVHQHSAGTAPAPPWDPRHRRCFTFLSANLCLLPGGLARFSNLGRTRSRARRIARLLAPGTPEETPGDRAGLLEPRQGEPKGYGGTLGTARSWHGPGARGDTGVEMAWEVLVEDPVVVAYPAQGLEVPAADPSPVASPVPAANAMPWLEVPAASPSLNPSLTANATPWLEMAVTDPAATASPSPADSSVPTLVMPMSSPSPGPAPPPESPAAPSVLSEHIPPDTDFVCLQEVFDGAAAAVLRRQLGRRFPFVLWGVGPGGLRQRRLRVLGSGLVLGSRFPLLAARFQPFPNGAREDALANKGLLLAQHRLFEEYQDPCRRGPGQDQPWAIGTLLNYLKIYEEPVSTPEKMKRTLSQPWGRQQYLAGPILCNGDPDPAAPRPWRGRRVDYALHRRHPALPTEVAAVSVITQLATFSDHLPVALRLRVGPAGP